MTVNWQEAFGSFSAQFNADGAIHFASSTNMNDKLNNQTVHSIIKLSASDENEAVTTLYTKAMASGIDVTKLKLD